MVLLINDPYGGGQEEVRLGSSRITPRETYSANPSAIQNQYRDRMSQVNQLTDALSGFGRAVGDVEKKQQEEELKQTNTLAASIIGEINGDASIKDQVAARFPQASHTLQARVSETLGIWHANAQGQKFIEQAMTDPTLTTPEAVQARLAERLAEEAARVGKQNLYGPSYMDML